MDPFSGGGRLAHVATNMSNHMMRSITTSTCNCLLKQCYFVCISSLESNRTGRENFKLEKLVDTMNVET